jgi:hypothetical protein
MKIFIAEAKVRDTGITMPIGDSVLTPTYPHSFRTTDKKAPTYLAYQTDVAWNSDVNILGAICSNNLPAANQLL